MDIQTFMEENEEIEEIQIFNNRDCYTNIGRWLSKDMSLREVFNYCRVRRISGFCKNGRGKYYIKDREYDSLVEKLEDGNRKDYERVKFFVIKYVE